MYLNRVKARLERLERRIKRDHCAGCIRTVNAWLATDKSSISPDLPHCRDCGNPHPKIPLWYLDELTKGLDHIK
jgi:hypothetical protein